MMASRKISCGPNVTALKPGRSILLIWVLAVFLCAPGFALDCDRSIVQFHYTIWSENGGAPSQMPAEHSVRAFERWLLPINSDRSSINLIYGRGADSPSRTAGICPSWRFYNQ